MECCLACISCLAGFAKDNAKDLVTGAGKQLEYACCFNTFVEGLENETSNLSARRDDVRDSVEIAKKQSKKISRVKEKWLNDANTDIAEVDELLKKARTNWFCRWYLGKQLEDKKGDVANRTEEGKQFPALERRTPLPSGINSENYLTFESRGSAYEQLMEAVKNNNVQMIGLYGMGGCGKTTLAKEVGSKADAEHLVDIKHVGINHLEEVSRSRPCRNAMIKL